MRLIHIIHEGMDGEKTELWQDTAMLKGIV